MIEDEKNHTQMLSLVFSLLIGTHQFYQFMNESKSSINLCEFTIVSDIRR